MVIEFTCLSCTRTFSVPIDDLPRMDYLACIGCGRPVPVDLLNAVKLVGESLSASADRRKNESLWCVRFKIET
jgi:hypothetical protein